jgi:hypothetical protein
VRFDDRLLTVLSQPAADRLDIAVRWRQLVDLVARAGSNASSANFAQALDTIRLDARNVDQPLRAAAARAVAPFPLPLGLLAYFASDVLDVSAPVLAAATLEPAEWREILAGAAQDTRRFVATLHPEILSEPAAVGGGEPKLLSAPTELTDDLIETPDQSSEDSGAHEVTDEQVEQRTELIARMVEAPSVEKRSAPAAPSLKEVVERIERRRRNRSAVRGALAAPLPPSPLFRWECGAGGEISWVDGAPRGALIGRSIARARNGEGDRVDRDVVRAFTVRAPFRDGTLTIAGDGSVAGEWKISGVPAFDPADGRFRGYRGIAIREQDSALDDEAIDALADPDSLRELVHEIKTPLNAIIGFAEIIEGQYLGPADPPYRERAQEIVKQARLLLLAIDDLDFAAKIHTSGSEEVRRADLNELIERMAPALSDLAAARAADLGAPQLPRPALADVERELADRLIFRMCSAAVEQAAEGEHLRVSVEPAGERWRVSITRPERLARLTDEQLLGRDGDFDDAFPLRLLRGLGQIAGVRVEAPEGRISLLFPRA